MAANNASTVSANWLFDEIANIIRERNNQTWRDHAACKGLDTEMFFPTGNFCAKAEAVCRECPVKEPCREYAYQHKDSLFGVWAETTRKGRREHRVRLQTAAA